jgi:CRP-like cAMP-binding protein
MGTPTGNLVLDALEDRERADLLMASRSRPIEVDRPLIEPGDPIEVVYFPRRGTLSLIALPEPDKAVEAATIGREGFASAFAALGSRQAGQRLIGQIQGEMIEVPIDDFTKAVNGRGRLGELVHGYIEALFLQSSINTACNTLHHVNQRCARWLLQSHDRVDGDAFGLKQEFLAIMLGVSRPTVSVAAETLQAAGYITYKRGQITILDRTALEEAACPCYEAIRSEYARLVPRR